MSSADNGGSGIFKMSRRLLRGGRVITRPLKIGPGQKGEQGTPREEESWGNETNLASTGRVTLISVQITERRPLCISVWLEVGEETKTWRPYTREDLGCGGWEATGCREAVSGKEKLSCHLGLHLPLPTLGLHSGHFLSSTNAVLNLPLAPPDFQSECIAKTLWDPIKFQRS